eukprot:21105-Heterococcus_DN1.PRE.2
MLEAVEITSAALVANPMCISLCLRNNTALPAPMTWLTRKGSMDEAIRAAARKNTHEVASVSSRASATPRASNLIAKLP